MYKVVIIDDEPWTRGVIRNLGNWEQHQMEVVGEAADGETGLLLIDEVHPDVIITDVRMPRLSGLDMLLQLQEKGQGACVIVISGYDDFTYVRTALTLGVKDYLLKPIKPQELNDLLARCAEELKKNARADESAQMMAGFFAEGWEKEYNTLSRKIQASLGSGNQALLHAYFEQMSKAIQKNESENPTPAILMAIYYSLLLPLERYIQEMGSNKQEVFRGKNTVFVFSRENTLPDMIHFLEELYRTASEQILTQQKARTRLDIETVCQYIQKNYTRGVSLEETADRFYVTKEYLSKAFKQAKGEGFSEYITALRMNHAYKLITEYHAPLKEVGAMVGYLDQAHFYKTFKKYYGKTPGEVRDRLKNDNETG